MFRGFRSAQQLRSRIVKNPLATQKVRWLNLHEYQSKELMNSYGVRVQKGHVASSASEALDISNKLKADGAVDLILKAQILAGGRGKGSFDNGFKSGVHVLQKPEDVAEISGKMLGNNLI
eukprot:410047_1